MSVQSYTYLKVNVDGQSPAHLKDVCATIDEDMTYLTAQDAVRRTSIPAHSVVMLITCKSPQVI